MVKWPFRRKNDASEEQPEYQVPSEIQDYYQAERRERAGIAWLMATGTLVVTIILAVGLFFGGRWAYRKVKGNDSQQAATNSNVEQATGDNQPQTPQASSANTSQPSPTPPAAPTPPPPAAPTPSTAPAASTPPATSSASTSAQSNLPNTGPGNVVAGFIVATILGTSAHYLMTNRRTSRSN